MIFKQPTSVIYKVITSSFPISTLKTVIAKVRKTTRSLLKMTMSNQNRKAGTQLNGDGSFGSKKCTHNNITGPRDGKKTSKSDNKCSSPIGLQLKSHKTRAPLGQSTPLQFSNSTYDDKENTDLSSWEQYQMILDSDFEKAEYRRNETVGINPCSTSSCGPRIGKQCWKQISQKDFSESPYSTQM